MERLVLDLVHGITSPDDAVRARTADEVTDVHKGFSATDVAVVVQVIVAARLRERDVRCQEAQLHALAEMAEWHELPSEPVALLAFLETTSDPSQQEYLDYLLDGAGSSEQTPPT